MRFPVATTIVLLFGLSGPAGADDDPNDPDAKLTQREYRAVTETTASPGHAEAARPPVPMHALSDKAKAALQTVHAQKIIGGKRWKKLSPEQRDDHMRNLAETAPAGTTFMIEVATGDVWLIPPHDPKGDAAYEKAISELEGVPPGSGLVQPWQVWEVQSLPVAVSNAPTSGDRPGRQEVFVNAVKVDF